MSKYTTIQQHEPLRVPEGWGTQEKRFIAQLEELLDDLYRRFNRLKISDLGDELRTIIQTDHASIEILNDTITLTAGEGMEIGTVSITKGGITVTGGEITIQAGTMLSMTSAGLVDINGASGSIDLGVGSSISAESAEFKELKLTGQDLLPVLYSVNRPGVHNVLWAEPHYSDAVYSYENIIDAGNPRTESKHALSTTYGTADSKLEFNRGGPSASGYNTSMRYRIKLPISRISGSDVSRKIYIQLKRGAKTVSFDPITDTFRKGEFKYIEFDTTSDVNLTTYGTSYDYYLYVWSTDATSKNKVYVRPGGNITLKITNGSVNLIDDEVTMHYIP